MNRCLQGRFHDGVLQHDKQIPRRWIHRNAAGLEESRRQRPSELSEEDRAHFVSQEIRRSVVATAMFLLAVGIYFGSRIETKRDGRPNAWFIAIWLAVFALVIVLLTLALVDWVSTRRYARRQRQTILREGLQILGEELRRRAEPPSDGHA